MVVSACGSSSEESAPSPKPVGAQENAVTSGAVCYGWPNGTTDAQPCAVGLKGPGGGRVFYDAGSVQPWGRFLEVAPQAWGGTLYSCDSCGAAPGVTKATSDDSKGDGYFPCGSSKYNVILWPGQAGTTGAAIGDGRRNTELLLQTPECVNGTQSAVALASGYRGLGLADWYLPSAGELVALCKYEGRNAIGGFRADYYVSSTSYSTKRTIGNAPDLRRNFTRVDFERTDCQTDGVYEEKYDGEEYNASSVRPIRAFA